MLVSSKKAFDRNSIVVIPNNEYQRTVLHVKDPNCMSSKSSIDMGKA